MLSLSTKNSIGSLGLIENMVNWKFEGKRKFKKDFKKLLKYILSKVDGMKQA